MVRFGSLLLVLTLIGCTKLPSEPLQPSEPSPKSSRIEPAAGSAHAAITPPVFVRSWGGFGTAPGQFDSPQAIAVGRNGHLYVADSGNHRVQEFTNTGELVRVWGHPSEDPRGYDLGGGAFHYPRGIAVDS